MTTDIKRFSATLDFIENHLFEDISLKLLAKQALLSEYTFHRFFTYLTGHSFSNYVRNRRLSEAVELLRAEYSIDEVADMCGYANRSAFNRAFSKFHNITPSQVNNPCVSINYFPPIRFEFNIDGGTVMPHRIEKLPEFRIVGKMKEVSLDDKLLENTYTQWMSFFGDPRMKALEESKVIRKGFFGVNRAPYFAVANPSLPNSNYLNYFTGFVLDGNSQSSEYLSFTIPEQTYVVFSSEAYDVNNLEKVPTIYDDLHRRIYNTWFPQTKYEKCEGPELETYNAMGKNACLEIWIPIKN